MKLTSYIDLFFSVVVSHTPSNLRPTNPTPAHAAGQGSPAPIRPSNPTPHHASKTVPERPGKWNKTS